MSTSTATSDAFLGGQGVPVDPSRIESELQALWGPAAEEAGGPDLDDPMVTRLVLGNLVMSAFGPGAEAHAPVLTEVVARYPCRAIVMRRDDAPGRRLRAEVSALCHLPAPGLPQVCSERIVLRTGSDALDLMPGAIRPLVESDLPFILWWTDDPAEAPDLFADLLDEVTRAIIDRPDPVADPSFLRDLPEWAPVRDTAWFGITPWRELIAQLFDPTSCREELGRIATVEVTTRASTAERPPRAGAWLVGWLAGQLGWTPRTCEQGPNDRFNATFDGPTGPVVVTSDVELAPDAAQARIVRVRLTTRDDGGAGTFELKRVARHAEEVRVEVCSATHCNLPRLVHAPELDPARRVASALEARREDGPYDKALPITRWMLGLGT
jgi:hypothetical protein